MTQLGADRMNAAGEIAGCALLLTMMGFVALGCLRRAAGLLPPSGIEDALTLASETGGLVFAGLVCLLTVIRLPSARRENGWRATLIALTAAFGMTIVNRMPVAALGLGGSLAAAGLLAAGNVATVYCLAHLGRSFSVLPSARRLVRSGPYAVVRHPLYLAEAIASAGLVILHWSALALAIGLLQAMLQWLRLRHEEQVLAAAFPEYRAYAAVTPCLLPGWRAAPTR